jgi:ketosteroid isomerase-like protein
MTNADIVAVVEQLIEAENTANADGASRLLAPDFTAITRARGVEQDRAALLDEVANPKSSVERRLEGELSVRQSGDLAVARSVVAVLDGSSPPVLSRFRNIHVLTWHGDAWKCVAWQVTKLS